MSYRCFDVTTSDKVAHVVLKRGDELNTMTPEFWSELPAIVNELSAGGSVRALVVSSTGKHFSAGMDLSVFGGALAPGDEVETGRRNSHFRLMAKLLQDSFTAFERARMPVLAAIQGGCIGGAIDMVSACDLRYASADAFFVVQEINIGMTADVGTLQRLPKIVPDGVARELAYLGRRMPAQRAYEIGLVNEVFPDHAALVDGTLEIAAEIAAKSPLAMWGSKVAINYARDHSVAEALEQVATWQAGMFQPKDMLETFAAKGEKRTPVFDDLLPEPTSL